MNTHYFLPLISVAVVIVLLEIFASISCHDNDRVSPKMMISSLHHLRGEHVDDNDNDSSSWYDCSEEIRIRKEDRILSFANVYSDPVIVTPKSGQIIYKTIRYDIVNNTNDDHDEGMSLTDDHNEKTGKYSQSKEKTLERITVDFHQYFKLFNKKWITFLVVHNVNECKEHDNLCPLNKGETKTLKTVHPPLNPMTPFGWYRSRQIYKDPKNNNKKIGCVDMSFLYGPSQMDVQHKQMRREKFGNGSESNLLLTASGGQ